MQGAQGVPAMPPARAPRCPCLHHRHHHPKQQQQQQQQQQQGNKKSRKKNCSMCGAGPAARVPCMPRAPRRRPRAPPRHGIAPAPRRRRRRRRRRPAPVAGPRRMLRPGCLRDRGRRARAAACHGARGVAGARPWPCTAAPRARGRAAPLGRAAQPARLPCVCRGPGFKRCQAVAFSQKKKKKKGRQIQKKERTNTEAEAGEAGRRLRRDVRGGARTAQRVRLFTNKLWGVRVLLLEDVQELCILCRHQPWMAGGRRPWRHWHSTGPLGLGALLLLLQPGHLPAAGSRRAGVAAGF